MGGAQVSPFFMSKLRTHCSHMTCRLRIERRDLTGKLRGFGNFELGIKLITKCYYQGQNQDGEYATIRIEGSFKADALKPAPLKVCRSLGSSLRSECSLTLIIGESIAVGVTASLITFKLVSEVALA